jgi:hypothetical protein
VASCETAVGEYASVRLEIIDVTLGIEVMMARFHKSR